MRPDATGFFWNDLPTTRASRGKEAKVDRGNRPLPPIPETGWEAPRDFPRLDSADVIALDTETYDPDLLTKGPGVRRDGHIVGISVATRDKSWYFPMRHTLGRNLDPENVIAWAKDQLTHKGQLKVGANLLYDLDYLAQAGVHVPGPYWDVQIAEALINENRLTYALDDLAQEYLNRGKESSLLSQWVRDAYGDTNYRAHIWHSPAELVGPYGEADAALPLLIQRQQIVNLEGDNLLELNDIEQRLIPLLLAMRRRGVRVDLDKARQLESRLQSEIEVQQKTLDTIAGVPVDVGKPAAAFDALGIPYPLTAKTKKPSFVKEWLEHHPSELAQRITKLRTLDKFLTTFVRGYILDLHVDGRIHCQFNQAKGDEYGTVSGRLSSSLPNLQNIPSRDEEWGPLIRGIFLPEEGEDWIKFDWSQIEFRFVTHYGEGESADRAREMYSTDPRTDFHRMVAQLVWPDAWEHMRRPAKNINFGLVYGMGEVVLSEHAGMSLEEAKPIFAEYHQRLPFIRDLYNATAAEAKSHGYITTIMNRRRRFHLWEPRYWNAEAERQVGLPLDEAIAKWGGNNLRRAYTHKALNGRIQGSAADLMKLAMVLLWESNVISELGAPLLTVHDELDWSAKRTKAAKAALREVRHIMENCYDLSVPIVADMTSGRTWGEAK